jgi:hypothetical protein
MAHFHHGHSAAAPIKQFFPDALKHRKRQSPRPRIEIVYALHGAL